MSGRFGSGNYQFELVKGWGDSWPVEGVASDVATDSNGQVYLAGGGKNISAHLTVCG